MAVDYLIVGAGFSGLVMAERLTTQLGKRCMVIDQRDHVGGNCYDEYDEAGILVHRYGPHYFRTNSDKIIDYLSQFTEWHPVDYQIKSYSDGRLWSFPINLNTFEELIGRPSTSEEMQAWLDQKRVPIENPVNSEEVIISQVGWELYEKFFKGYTRKHWKCDPKDLDVSVCGRIPIRTNRDDRYLKEEFQALPKEGYTRLFERMIEACGDLLEIRLQTSFEEAKESIRFKRLVYTGPIDQYFNYRHGKLPYRSVRFEPESFGPETLKERETISGKRGFWQAEMQINYPNDEDFTRIVEIKHATGQSSDHTTIVREYPEDVGPHQEPYYPIPNQQSQKIYQQYKQLAETEEDTIFTGRLATYRYYNMDQVVAMALKEFERLNS
ncbi:MAG: UDP-galactopyranose mutase [Verrucomicrobiota bacterium]